MNIASELLKAFSTHSQNIALVDGSDVITYSELLKRSERIAGYLLKNNLKNACIIVDVDNVTDHIIALLGVVLSGNYYLSVNDENRCFLTPGLPIAATISVQLLHEVLEEDCEVVYPAIMPQYNMCAFFTSGSTGSAKLVIHSHKNIYADTLRQIIGNKLTENDKVDLVFSLTFSASLACIYPALLTGAQLCLFNLKDGGLHKLADFWLQQGITFSTLSVGTFHSVCKLTPSLHHLTHLRFVSISAEPVKNDTIQLFQSTFNAHVTLQIAYASTETRTISEMKIKNNGDIIPYPDAIGKPVEGKIVCIIDQHGNYLSPGNSGEIVVQSDLIAKAYYGLTEESKQSFTTVNDVVYYRTGDLGYLNNDGFLFYKGRLVNENKLNGVKINMAVIEQVTERVNGVIKAAAVINKFKPEQPKLVCFYETSSEVVVNLNTLKHIISSSLPVSHVPQFFLNLNQLPLTHSGKVDRKQLESFDITVAVKPEPKASNDKSNVSEKIIIEIFKNVLQDESITAESNFYDAGGDSMTTLICVSEIGTRFNITLSVASLFANPTPRKMYQFVSEDDKRASFISKIHVNGYDPQKKTLYFLTYGYKDIYRPFYDSILSSKYNLIEVFFDLYADASTEYVKIVFDQIVADVAQYTDIVVLGLSFNGFIAHQLACRLPQITYIVLLDTFNYFDYDIYRSTKNLKDRLALKLWNILNGDVVYATHFLTKWLKTENNVKEVDEIKRVRNEKKIEQINHFLSGLQYATTINHCIYFQATRRHKQAGKTWGQKVGGKFYYKTIRCGHNDILNHAAYMIRVIDKIIS